MAKPLMEVLGQIRGGAAINDAAKDFVELCQRVRDTGKPGSITLTIKVNPDKNDPDVYEVTPDVTVKLPKVARAKGLFYMTGRQACPRRPEAGQAGVRRRRSWQRRPPRSGRPRHHRQRLNGTTRHQPRLRPGFFSHLQTIESLSHV